MGSALAGLTTRGRCLLAAGAALCVCAVLLGQRDLLRAGVFLLALPPAAVLLVSRTRYRLACSRRVEPSRVEAGRPAEVRVRVENISRLPTGVLLMEDVLPYVLGGRPRFVLDRVPPQAKRDVTYTVRSEVRGRYRIGPLTVRMTDAFGLVELTRSFAGDGELVVTPVVSVLPRVSLGGMWVGGGESTSRSLAISGADDVTTREYRHGDDLRKVHWRSTARVGELMVRTEEQPYRSRATVLLDGRALAHRGEGAGSSHEWAVSAAASIAVSLAHTGVGLRMLDENGHDLVPESQPVAEGVLLEVLAGVTPTRETGLGPAVEALRRSGVNGVLVAVLGSLAPGDLERLARLRQGSAGCVAVLLDTDTWAPGRAGGSHHRDAALHLRANGWRVLEITHGTTLASVWPQAANQMLSSYGLNR